MGFLSNNSLGTYLCTHWKGQQSLSRSFGINFISLGLVCLAIHAGINKLLAGQESTLFYLNIFLFSLFWFVIFPWQVIGVVRASENPNEVLRNSLWIKPMLAGLLLTTVFFFTTFLSLIQAGYDLHHEEDSRFMEIFFGEPDFRLVLNPDNSSLTITGTFDHGLTRALEKQLQEAANIQTIVLNSTGGSPYEARGVAKLILAKALDTHVEQECSSSCVLAYLAGKYRTLSETSRLGFHQYRIDADYVIPNQQQTLADEEHKDQQFYQQRGVDFDFHQRVFITPADQTWFPDTAELLQAGVSHKIVATQM